MDVFDFHKPTMKYRRLFSCGALRPFTEMSLVEQILNAVKLMSKNDCEYIVFSKEESDQVHALAKQVVGGLRTNQGLGHGIEGTQLLLWPLLRQSGLSLTSIPADGNGNQTYAQVKNWLLAVGRM